MEPSEQTNINIFFDKYDDLKSDVDIFDINDMNKDISKEENIIDILSEEYLNNLLKKNDLDNYDFYLKNLNLMFQEYKIFETKNLEIHDDISCLNRNFSFELKDLENKFKKIKSDIDNLDIKFPTNNSDNYFDFLKNENNILIKNKNKKKFVDDLRNTELKISRCKTNIDTFSKYNLKDEKYLDLISNNILIVLDQLEKNYKDFEIEFNRKNIDLAINLIEYPNKINIKNNFASYPLINYIKNNLIITNFLMFNCLLILTFYLNFYSRGILISTFLYFYSKILFKNNIKFTSINNNFKICYPIIKKSINFYKNEFIISLLKFYSNSTYKLKLQFMIINIFIFLTIIFYINNLFTILITLLNYLILLPKILNNSIAKLKII